MIFCQTLNKFNKYNLLFELVKQEKLIYMNLKNH